MMCLALCVASGTVGIAIGFTMAALFTSCAPARGCAARFSTVTNHRTNCLSDRYAKRF